MLLNRITRLVALSSIGVLLALAAGCAKPKVNVQVSRDRIQQGEDVKVNWTSKDAKAVTLNGEKVDKTGSKVFTPSNTTTYMAIASRGKKEARDSKTVSVASRPPRPAISMSAEPPAIIPGQSSTLRWSSTNADRVSISDLGSVPPSGSRAVSPAQSTTYTATALGPGGSESASARVTVTEDSRGRTTVDTVPPVNTTVATLFNQNVRAIFFDYDKSDLRPEAKDVLRRSAAWLTQSPFRSVVFRIEGDCDPRGTEEYNLGLGERRAQSAKEFLASLGIDPSRMSTISYGKERASGTNEGTPDSPPSFAHDRNDLFVYISGGTAPSR
jgi:peptidoglycan-associated lipoprotein